MEELQSNDDESEYPTLRRVKRAFLLVLAILFAGIFLLLGVAPGGLTVVEGLIMASLVDFALLREEIERHLTEVQEWTLFALFGTACVVVVLATGGELSGELLLGYVVCLAASGLFIYRAKAAA